MLKLKNYQRILIVRPDRLGDLILSLPVSQLLKSLCPKAEIHYLVSSYAAPILKYASYIDGHLLYADETNTPIALAKLAEQITDGNYDAAISLKPNWRSAFAIYLAGIKTRIGTSRRPYSLLFNRRENIKRKNSNMHEVELNLLMLKPFGIEPPPKMAYPRLEIKEDSSAILSKYGLPEKYIIIHPGSNGSSPNWPIDNYLELVKKISNKFNVVLTGQDNLNYKLPENVIDLCNLTTLDELVHIIGKANLFISGSTGPLHIACALDTPVIALFPNHPYLGPARWGPRSQKSVVITPPEQSEHLCRINDMDTCECMRKIDVDAVYNKIIEMMP